tara:strand:- start:1900 stop:2163 length:264 start_codon:yes stop_codon:yes gene_type:complete
MSDSDSDYLQSSDNEEISDEDFDPTEVDDCDFQLNLNNILEVDAIRFVLRDDPLKLNFFNTLIKYVDKKIDHQYKGHAIKRSPSRTL